MRHAKARNFALVLYLVLTNPVWTLAENSPPRPTFLELAKTELKINGHKFPATEGGEMLSVKMAILEA